MDSSGGRVKWRCTQTSTILEVLRNRNGWSKGTEDDWDFFWCGREWMMNFYEAHSFKDSQRVCHYRNDYELCKKDNLVRNLKKMRRQLEKSGDHDEAAKYEFLPASFVLPRDYHMFLEAFRRERDPKAAWIMKPVGGAQGRGIFIFQKLKDIKDWRKRDAPLARNADGSSAVQSYVVQKYINNPYLIGGKKFDTRIYVLLTNFRPMEAWLHREGFARFSHSRYAADDITDAYSHLTNVAIAKTAPDYDPDTGTKWSLFRLRRFLTQRHGASAVAELSEALGWLLVRSLRAVQDVIVADQHCFELFGFDVLIDDQLRPWLIEVNASPSLVASSEEDRQLKTRVLSHLLDVVDIEKRRDPSHHQVGGYDRFLQGGEPVEFGSQLGKANPFAKRLNVHLGAPYKEHCPGNL